MAERTHLEKITDRIVGLLNKAESTTSEHERDALLETATQLRLKYLIEDADLRSRSQDKPKEKIIVRDMLREKHAAYIKAKRELVFGLASLNHCKSVLIGKRDYIQIMGFQTDVDYVQFLYASLLLQMERSIAREQHLKPSYESLRTWKTSFAHAYVRRVVSRLKGFQVTAEASTPGTELVLRDRNKEVVQQFEVRYPRLRQMYKNTSTNSMDGYSRGDAAGQRANLGRQQNIDQGRTGQIGS